MVTDSTDAAANPTNDTDAREIGVSAVNREYRIRRFDRLNWCIEQWIPPGKKHNGTTSRGRWETVGYYPRLEMAAQRVLDNVLLDGPELRTAAQLIADVRQARDYVADVVQQCFQARSR